jgi:hypothetical protein
MVKFEPPLECMMEKEVVGTRAFKLPKSDVYLFEKQPPWLLGE